MEQREEEGKLLASNIMVRQGVNETTANLRNVEKRDRSGQWLRARIQSN
jgi:hypothetical protein